MDEPTAKPGVRSIAKALGLATSSVSRALNDAPDVSKDTRARVLAKASELGYQPNRAARRLRRQRGIDIVGYLHSLVEDLFADQQIFDALHGLSGALSERDIELTVHLSPSIDDELRTLQRMIDGNVVDAVVLGQTRLDDERIAYLEERGVLYATLGQSNRASPYRHVDIDNCAAAYRSTKLLIEAGYRRPVLLRPFPAIFYSQMQAQGFRRALDEAGYGERDDVHVVDFTSEASAKAAAGLLDTGDADSFVCASDLMAAGVYSAATRLGRNVGKDVGVTGFGNHPASIYLRPSLTTYDPPMRSAGRRLAELLLDDAVGSEIWPAESITGQSHQRS